MKLTLVLLVPRLVLPACYRGGRYYDPGTGRYLTPDHSNFDPRNPSRTLNAYLTLFLFGPLLVVVGWRRWKGKHVPFMLWLLLGASLAVTLIACDGGDGIVPFPGKFRPGI